MNKQIWYKVKWVNYEKITWELKENFKNAEKKVKEYYKKVGQAMKKVSILAHKMGLICD